MKYKSFKIVNASELDYIDKGINAAFDKWCSIWCRKTTFNTNISVQEVNDTNNLPMAGEIDWQVGSIDKNYDYGVYWSDALVDTIFDLFVETTKSSGRASTSSSLISSELIKHSMSSLLEIIFSEFSNKQHTISLNKLNNNAFIENINRFGSGYVLATIDFSAKDKLLIVLNVSSVIKTDIVDVENIPLSPAINAFGDSKIKLRVLLGEAELDVQSVTSLSIGDVISIDSSLNEKLSIEIDGREICDGYIGHQDGVLSVKIDNPKIM